MSGLHTPSKRSKSGHGGSRPVVSVSTRKNLAFGQIEEVGSRERDIDGRVQKFRVKNQNQQHDLYKNSQSKIGKLQ